MISLYKDPDGNKVFGKSIPASSAAGNTTHSAQNVELLKTRIKELESLVASLNVSERLNIHQCDDQLYARYLTFQGNDSAKQNGSAEVEYLDIKDFKEWTLSGKDPVESAIETMSGERDDTSHTIWDTNGSAAI